jgi:hypothetical protein
MAPACMRENQYTHTIRLRAADTNAVKTAYVSASSVGREGARIKLHVHVGAINEIHRP